MVGEMRLKYPGLIAERLKSGNLRYRVRLEGDSSRKITLPVDPKHPEFHQAYRAARCGVKYSPSGSAEPDRGTVEWLVSKYLKHLEEQVCAGQASPLTLKQRRPMAKRLLAHKSSSGRSAGRIYAGLPMEIPAHELVSFRDSLMATPGAAKNTFKFLKAMYGWAVERNICAQNPAASITVDYKSQGGATPWTLDDLAKYRKAHPPGTMAHLCLTLFMFTACRISDAYRLGRDMEVRKDGQVWLAWTPAKRGARLVEIPMLPPLYQATRAARVIGPTYLLTDHGKPFKSPEGLRNKFNGWMKDAKIENRSSHGIRKAAGHLLALNGATQYEIMAIHGHAQASTSEIYTQSVERMRLAAQGASRLSSMDW